MNTAPTGPVTRAFLVGEDYRKRGRRGSACSCAVALAVAAAFDYEAAYVLEASVAGWDGTRVVARGLLGAAAVRWMQLYDMGEDVGDLALTLTMEPMK
jgi:hypothetical protein